MHDHDVLLAEGQPAESYLDVNDRSNFVNGGKVRAVHPDFSSGAWETSAKVSHSIAEILRFGLPEDYFKTYPDKVLALNLPEVEQAARVVRPDQLVWVIVGDLSKIEPGIRELGLGEIRLIDNNGKVLKP